jgi:4-hydroxybenzoate polyprenyltransferase
MSDSTGNVHVLRGVRSLRPLIDRLPVYARLVRLDRPAGMLLLLWPTLWALWIATQGAPSLHLFLVFTLGVVLTRSAGCALNDLADRDFDPHVERTRGRPLAARLMTPGEALGVAVTLLVAAFLLVLTTNHLTVLLAFVGVPLMAIYPFMKRWTYVPQFFLGMAFGWGIPMAFAAATGSVPRIAWLVFIANILWSVIYDTMYAMADRDDDLRIGVKSTAILFGEADRLILGILQGMMLAVLAVVARQMEFGAPFGTALVMAAALMAYHQYLIRNRDRAGCMRAFAGNNWLGLVVFAGIVLEYLPEP